LVCTDTNCNINDPLKKNNLFGEKMGILHLVVIHRHIEMMTLLLTTEEVDVNVVCSVGSTPLNYACRLKDGLPLVQTLLEHPNIQVNIKNEMEHTPLFVACLESYVDIIQALLRHPQISVTNAASDGYIPLHKACATGNETIVGMLLSYQPGKYRQAQLNATTGKMFGKLTPLHIACQSCQSVQVVQRLLDHNMDININAVNDEGNTALSFICDFVNCERFVVLQSDLVPIIQQLLQHPYIDVTRCQKKWL
jgi:ankyrin repeat protein